MSDCAGHFGYIQLELPVFHGGYFRHTLTILQCICKMCSRVLLSPEDILSYLKKLRNSRLDALQRAGIFKRINDLCKRTSICPHCGYANGVVKKMPGGFFKIVHERYRAKSVEGQLELQIAQMHEIIKMYPELKPNIQRSVVRLYIILHFLDIPNLFPPYSFFRNYLLLCVLLNYLLKLSTKIFLYSGCMVNLVVQNL